MENSLIANMTIGTVADDNESFAQSSYIHRHIIISVSASLFLIIAGAGVLVMIVICIYQARKRRQAVCRNLERQYETVDEPVYETILSNNPNVEVWSDCNTKCNEAYQKTGLPLHVYSELSER